MHIWRNMVANTLNLLAFAWRNHVEWRNGSKIDRRRILLDIYALGWMYTCQKWHKTAYYKNVPCYTRISSRGTHFVRRLLVDQLLSPTKAITSRLLGGEIVRFGLRRWPKLGSENCSYLGQYFELRKNSSCKNI